MFDENQVIEAVCRYLKNSGYKILQRLQTTQSGIDIIAKHRRQNTKILVEAKGGTSSREGSKRFGKPYTKSQVFDRAAKGLHTALKLHVENLKHKNTRVILVCPDTKWFREYLQPIKQIVDGLSIQILLVKKDSKVIPF